jgi:pSer/pThr/pTyr-binding forkhead associated (FHA) protein
LGNGLPYWEISDLNSANGTYINGQSLQGWHQLQAGDRIELGQDGPQFILSASSIPVPLPSIPHRQHHPLTSVPPQAHLQHQLLLPETQSWVLSRLPSYFPLRQQDGT